MILKNKLVVLIKISSSFDVPLFGGIFVDVSVNPDIFLKLPKVHTNSIQIWLCTQLCILFPIHKIMPLCFPRGKIG